MWLLRIMLSLVWVSIALALALIIGGCGVLGGGASYRAELTGADGRRFVVRADSATSAEEVTFDFIGNPLTGEITGLRFSKRGVQPGEAVYKTISEIVARIPVAP